MTFIEVQKNIYIITLATKSDEYKVMEDWPWTFDNSIFVLKRLDGLSQPTSILFDTKAIWIQLHKMPIRFMNHFYGNLLGSSLGTVLEIDAEMDDKVWGNFLRVRIEIQLSKPLTRGRSLVVKGEKIWTLIQYEKLPRFCFFCGKIFHDIACQPSLNPNFEPQFGTWLHAYTILRSGSIYSKLASSSQKGNNHYQALSSLDMATQGDKSSNSTTKEAKKAIEGVGFVSKYTAIGVQGDYPRDTNLEVVESTIVLMP